MKTAPKTVKPNEIKARDYAMVALINGATKAGAFKNHKKEQSRRACRGKVRADAL